jgi:NAD(P)-dependent dehydrogenase (short-subunit alcohol dehydrogenase family)
MQLGSATKLFTGAAAGYLGARALQRLTSKSLSGQTVLITGGSRGLGLALAREFGAQRCRLAICARDVIELERARFELGSNGYEVLALPCDVSNRVQVEALVDRVTTHFGSIDIVVNNASIIQAGPLESLEHQDFETAMDVNYWGTVNTTLAVLPQMRERGAGRIVNITSIGGKVAVPHLLPYDAAKFATVGFSEGLRAEVEKDGILVTTIVPGLMRTGSPVNAFFKGQAEREFAWFSLGDATPLTAMSATRAARLIVRAARRGTAELTLSWQAKLLRVAHDLFPSTIIGVLATVNRVLPGADGVQREVKRGMELASPISPSRLTAFMNRAARDLNQFGGVPRPTRQHAEQIGLEGPQH